MTEEPTKAVPLQVDVEPGQQGKPTNPVVAVVSLPRETTLIVRSVFGLDISAMHGFRRMGTGGFEAAAAGIDVPGYISRGMGYCSRCGTPNTPLMLAPTIDGSGAFCEVCWDDVEQIVGA